MNAFVALVSLLVACGAAEAQNVRGMPEQRATALKPDLTQGGGNSSVGATRPVLPAEKEEHGSQQQAAWGAMQAAARVANLSFTQVADSADASGDLRRL